MIRTDIAIICAGMAGASLAAALGGAGDVVILEAESHPGYHATGRSAAFWSETYGGPAIQPLTSASGPLLADNGFLAPRGALTIARKGEHHLLDQFLEEFRNTGVQLEPVDRAQLAAIVPGLREDWQTGVVEPSTRDIDVAALHAHYLKQAKIQGAGLICEAPVIEIARISGGWSIVTPHETIEAGILVNAAGAWASPVAEMAGAMPIAITPFRRTLVQLIMDPAPAEDMPFVIDVKGELYFKPEAGGRVWLSPHDEGAAVPGDAAPEEIDVAIAIDRLEHVVDWRVVRKERAWAGLRSFALDRAPVYGFDDKMPGFFWFAGQGGFGIQTAPAAAMIGAALIRGTSLPDPVAGIDIARYAPSRFA